MNSKSVPSPSQSILNSSNNPFVSSFTPHIPLKFNKTILHTSHISFRKSNISVKASSATGVCTSATSVAEETLYDLLGISESCTPSDIKQAYKQMALKYHPDVSPPDRTEEYTVRFMRVHEAYETLSDPESRFKYDTCMAKGLHMAFSGRRETRFDSRSDDKNRWKDTWTGQISELMRRSKVNPNKAHRVDGKGMSWAARIRKQRSESYVGSDQN